jgi:hypothetical protein
MSDYLSDLVTKNIGMANVIEPRRPARFEPLQTTSALEFEIEPTRQTDVFETEQTIESRPPARPRREVKLIEKTVETSSRTRDEEIEHAPKLAPREIHSPKTETRQTRVTLAPKTDEPPHESNVENFSLSNLSTPTFSPITPLRSPPKVAEKEEISSDKIEHAPIQTQVVTRETDNSKPLSENNSEPQTIEAREKIVIEPRVEKIENRFEETKIQQTVISPHEQASKQIAERFDTPPTPTINVTIGRVEVRAAVSSAPPKQAHAKPPTLSLDEYLRKRRNGGER